MKIMAFRIVLAGIVAGLLISANAIGQTTMPAPVRERLSLDRSWWFHEGDVPFPVILGHQNSYDNAKAGKAWGAADPAYNDSSWTVVDLPHDWAVSQPFDPKANLSQGYRGRGMGWYRKYFRLDPADHGKHLELQFDGIATHCTIWVNGVIAQRNWCGYTGMYIDITPYARFGDDLNVIAVQVDAVAQEGWWYEGAGIYRHAWLVKRSPVHIATDGVFANPVRDASGSWAIPVEVALESSDSKSAKVTVESTLIDPGGAELASNTADASVDPLQTQSARFNLAYASPKLWSIEQPTLYSVRTRVIRDGAVVDEVVTHCGFRTVRFDPDKGFFLNDQPVKLKGTANHQDFAGVGVAVPDSIWDFKIKRLKEMGSNAYRCAHNPPAAEFLDACDRLGMLVMDENRNFGTAPENMRQLEWMLRRDRNHPSIILWSVFNEEPSQGTEMGYEMVRRMSARVKEFDTSRPVTAAQSNSMLNPVNASQAADVAGFNYRSGDYDRYHAEYPQKPMFSSEDTSSVMIRGEYTTNRKECLLDSYDDGALPWGLTHRDAWKEVATRPYVAGTMVWTGFDYRGEPQPLPWPSAGASFGCMDLCGFPKAAYYIHQAQWIDDRPILQLVPHWNWAGSEGKPIKVMALTNCDHVELILNGKSLGNNPVDRYEMLTVNVPYEAGKLEAVGYKDNAKVAHFAVETTGAPAALQLVADRANLAGDGADAEPITVQAVDDQGRVVPDAHPLVSFELAGPGAIIGLNNGDPTCHEAEKGNQHSLFNGLGQVIIQSTPEGNQPITLSAKADGLKTAELTIQVEPAAAPPSVATVIPKLVLSSWRMSPVSAERPDPNVKIGETDMNTWATIRTGRLARFTGGGFAIMRTEFRPRSAGQKLILRKVTGKAEVWLDGQKVGEKTDAASGTITVALPATVTDMTVSVLIETDAGGRAGLGGTVTVE